MSKEQNDKGTLIEILADGHQLCCKRLPGVLDHQQSFNVTHHPEWGRTTVSYRAFENEEVNPALKALREFLKRPGWELKMVTISINEPEVEVITIHTELRTSKTLAIKDFQSIIELLGFLQYVFAVSPIGPKSGGRS